MAEKVATVIEIKGDIADIKKRLKELENVSGATQKRLSSGWEKHSKDVRNAALAITGGITAMGGMAVKAYMEQEREERKLAQAMKTTGQYSKELFDKYVKLSGQMQRMTVYTDDAALAAIQIYQRFGVAADQMERTMKVTADVASVMGIDLPAAAELVGKASLGMARGLKQLGIDMTEAEVKAEGLEGILARIEQKVGGAAQADVMSYAGAIKQLKNSFGETLELLGKVIVEQGDLQKGITALNRLLSGMTEAQAKAIVSVGELAGGLGALTLAVMGVSKVVKTLSGKWGWIGGITAAVSLLIANFESWKKIQGEILSDWEKRGIPILQKQAAAGVTLSREAQAALIQKGIEEAQKKAFPLIKLKTPATKGTPARKEKVAVKTEAGKGKEAAIAEVEMPEVPELELKKSGLIESISLQMQELSITGERISAVREEMAIKEAAWEAEKERLGILADITEKQYERMAMAAEKYGAAAAGTFGQTVTTALQAGDSIGEAMRKGFGAAIKAAVQAAITELMIIQIKELARAIVMAIPTMGASLANVPVILGQVALSVAALKGLEAAIPMAEGGIVKRPLLVGEAGAEAIIPLSRAGEMGLGATNNYYINISSEVDLWKVTEAIRRGNPKAIGLVKEIHRATGVTREA